MHSSVRNVKRRVYEILAPAAQGDRASQWFDNFISFLILLNVMAVVLETDQSIYALAPFLFQAIEIASILVFSIEYILRVWSCTEIPIYSAPIQGRMRFIVTPMALIDFFAILPFFVPIAAFDLRFVRAARLFRLARVAKLGRYSQAIRSLGRVLVAKKEDLVISLSVLAMLLLFASSFIYFAEHEAQPDAFSSIPAAMWWGVITLTTVGYGDIYPVTPPGKILASIIAILGIGMAALPTGMLGAGFVQEIERKKNTPVVCPHCGKEIDLD